MLPSQIDALKPDDMIVSESGTLAYVLELRPEWLPSYGQYSPLKPFITDSKGSGFYDLFNYDKLNYTYSEICELLRQSHPKYKLLTRMGFYVDWLRLDVNTLNHLISGTHILSISADYVNMNDSDVALLTAFSDTIDLNFGIAWLTACKTLYKLTIPQAITLWDQPSFWTNKWVNPKGVYFQILTMCGLTPCFVWSNNWVFECLQYYLPKISRVVTIESL